MTELGLRIPVEGVQLIEASAGTGKTFTVATLYARLVLELGLPVSKLLAVTYTEAAAKDLRDKLRERLARAATLVESLGAQADAAALAPREGEAAADAATRRLVADALARGEALPALRQRLRLAVAQMDLAPIHTIHGFCQRALREHALAAGQPLAPRALLTNEATLRREVATEFWRRHVDDADAIGALLAIWKSPEALAKELQELLGFDALLPARAPMDLRAARAAFAQAFDTHGAEAFELLRDERDRGAISTVFSKDEQLDEARMALERWRPQALASDPASANLHHFGTRYLQAKRLKRLPPPEHPFFDAIDAYLDAQRAARTNLVHAAVEFARTRLAELKHERQLVGFDDLIGELAQALEGANGDRLAAQLQAQYAIALVDEFQDTDPRQWRIFERLFAQPGEDDRSARALFLIGDPKQAIYRFRGGDVATYIIAKTRAQACHRLERNFRSRPLALQATAALFELGGEGAFDQPDIEFEPVQPGGACLDAHFQREGRVAPGLYLQQVAFPTTAPIEDVRRQLALNCVGAIHGLLSEGRAGGNALTVRHPDGTLEARPVRPGDITVLVGRNDDALRMQRALSEAGIPSVAAGRSSLYESEEARDVHAFLAALAAPADDGRLRALLATPLFGLDAAAIAAFDIDLAAHRHWQDQAQDWLAVALRRGAMAALAGVCARESARILAAAGGERRLSNYLQLVEELQAAEAGATGLAGLLAELDRRVQDADKNNDAELLRLESDAARVKIMTTHVSKGLNLDLVFVPFAAVHSGGSAERRAPRRAHYHEGDQRVAKLFAQTGERELGEDADEEFAEQVRVLYVALTRARFATWVGWGLCREAYKTPLAWLLHRAGEARPTKLDSLLVERALTRLLEKADGAIALLPSMSAERIATLPALRFESALALPPARVAARVLDRDWWVYSFSQLAREDSGAEARGAEDEAEPPPLLRQRFAGTRFGNALHAALETVRFADWRDWQGALPPPGQLEPLREALRREGFASDADLEDGLPLLTGLVTATLNTRLPEGTVLATRPPTALCVEMEFHLELAPVAVPALLALLHQHGLVDARRGFGLRARLQGLLTGRIDLVYEYDGRFYVLDYKSNLLPDYGAQTVARSVREHEYDLQYVLYTLALHRWLRFRLGAAYDITRHLGGVRYLFCRGLDPAAPDSEGVHARRLPDELVLALDALLATPREVAA